MVGYFLPSGLAGGKKVFVDRIEWVILKDPEQESCMILMLWAFAIMGYKFTELNRSRRMLGLDVEGKIFMDRFLIADDYATSQGFLIAWADLGEPPGAPAV
mgnify:CR=1 FL=1